MPTPRLRWGIIGTARINRRLAPAILAAGDRLTILGSRDPERGRAAAAELGAERSGSYADVLASPDVDAVYISLPNGLHGTWTIQAAEAGKHILCEKPLAPTEAECREMVSACERHGVHLVEAFMYRHHPRWQRVHQLVESGALGQVRMLRANFGFLLRRDGDIRLEPNLGGGALQDVGCYCVNVARWFLGEPVRVLGLATDSRGVGVDTHAAAVLEFGSGALALLECSFDTAGHQSFELIGERGRVEVPRAFLPPGVASIHIVDANGERVEEFPEVDPYALQIEAFDRLVLDGTPTLTPGDDAAATQAVIAAWRTASSPGGGASG
jgi:D-xylose 1-dehydrogenase (NADP+, D-xylono-1,5-lactone-forming)